MPSKRKFNEPVPVKALEVMSHVAHVFGIEVEEMLSRCRERRYVDARHMAMLLLYDYVYRKGKTLSTVGGWFNRDHTSVIHGISKIKDLISIDDNFRDYYKQLQKLTENIVEQISKQQLSLDERIMRLPHADKTAMLSYLEKVEKLRGIV